MATQRDQITTTPQLGRYEIDTDRSTVAFSTRHMFGLLPVHGTFAVRSGTVDVVEPLAESSVRVEIDTASFHTGNGHRDRDVRSRRFLDADRHPVMTFISERVDETTVTGVLTACGVARTVTLSIERFDVTAGAFTARATTRVDRTEFAVTGSRGMTGRYLDVSLEVVCVRR